MLWVDTALNVRLFLLTKWRIVFSASLDYVVNTYQTIFESNLIDKKANLLEKQLTAIDNKFSNYALKSETDTKLTQLDNYYDSLVEQLDSTYYDKVDCDEKFVLKSNVLTEEQLIKKCAIDCGTFTEGADISIHLLKIIKNWIEFIHKDKII